MRRIAPFLAVALLTFAFPASAPAAPSADARKIKQAGKLCTKGDNAMRGGNPAGAREHFERALGEVPHFPTAHIGLGHLAMARQGFDDALEHYRAAHDGYATLGAELMEVESKRYRSARDQIAALRDSIGQLQLATAKAGDTAFQISKLENAIRQLEAVEPPDPDRAGKPPGEIHFYIGNALFQLGRVEEAVGEWEACRRESPKFAMVYNNLALGYWKAGRMDEARENLARAEELGFPVNPQFKNDLENAAGGAR